MIHVDDDGADHRRQNSYRQTLAHLWHWLNNEKGLARLRAITDEEWDEARQRDVQTARGEP